MKKIELPLTNDIIKDLRVGQKVLISGRIYTARDQAHKRLVEALKNKRRLPINLKNQVIYYCGPAPARPGRIIGSCGPTTSSRMDKFTAPLLRAGLRGMIGKGARSKEVTQAIARYKAIYFLAPAGLGALLSKRVISARVAGLSQLGPEAIYELKVKDFPAIVGIDTRGRCIYKTRP
jgi:fumarate hydratase subunit beta